MALYRCIKKFLSGVKTITTNGTYNASSDGYDGYRQVTVNVPQITPAPITPSNTSPAQMTANTPVNPTANGYAIQSYDSVTPSSTPASVSSGDIVKMGGSGVIVDSIPTPTSLTPSNDTPATITSGETYTATANGYAVASYVDLYPSNSTPPPIDDDLIYKPMNNGYAISSYSSKTPSDSSPASVSSGAIIKASSSGYLYETVQPKVAVGTFTNSSSAVANVTVDIGFKPKYLCIWYASSVVLVYDERHNSGGSYFRTSSAPAFDAAARFNQSSTGNTIQSITSTGFIVRSSANRTWHYFAIG